MAEQSWWQRVIAAINREYERRIRRASLVSEYGANQHGHEHAHLDEPDHAEHDDGEVAEIVNVPRGTPIRRGQSEPRSGAEPPSA